MNSLGRRAVFAACLGAAFFCGQPCEGAYQWLRQVVYDCDPPGLEGYYILRIYAEFDNPGDRLVSAFGNPSSPVTITASNGFFQHPDGSNRAPGAESIAKDPTLEWDTFCTMGLAQSIDDADQTFLTPGFPAIPIVNNTSMGWMLPGSQLAQGAPDAGGRVLIMQLTLPDDSSLMQCKMGITYRPAGFPGNVTINNAFVILLPLTPGDVNSDLTVDIDDMFLVISTWGTTGQGAADIDDDGEVNIDDLMMVITEWGMTSICDPWN